MSNDQPSPRPFNGWLAEHRNGVLHGELSSTLAELVQSVRQTGRAGELRLTIKISPAQKGEDIRVLTVSDDIAVKTPRPERPTAITYTDEHGNLSRRDPRQPELPLGLHPVEGAAEAEEAQA